MIPLPPCSISYIAWSAVKMPFGRIGSLVILFSQLIVSREIFDLNRQSLNKKCQTQSQNFVLRFCQSLMIFFLVSLPLLLQCEQKVFVTYGSSMEWFPESRSRFPRTVASIVIIIALYPSFSVTTSIYTRNIGTNLGLVTFVLKAMVNSLIIHEGNPRDL